MLSDLTSKAEITGTDVKIQSVLSVGMLLSWKWQGTESAIRAVAKVARLHGPVYELIWQSSWPQAYRAQRPSAAFPSHC